MGVYEGRGQLGKGMKELMSAWLDTRSSWKDANAERFEKKHLVPLEMDIRAGGERDGRDVAIAVGDQAGLRVSVVVQSRAEAGGDRND